MIKNDKWIKSKCMPPLASVSFLRENGLRALAHMADAPLADLTFRDTIKIYGDPFTNLDEVIAKELERVKAVPGTSIVSLTSDIEMEQFKPMIEPFLPMQVRSIEGKVVGERIDTDTLESEPIRKISKIISKGLTSFGYDVSLAGDFKIFTNINSAIIDPLNFSEDTLIHVVKDDFVILPPYSYLLGHTPENFRMPRNVLALCVGKSTYARCGVMINVTPIEPGFEGSVVIEIVNPTSLPVKIYVNQGIAQFIFFEGEDCEVSYADRDGGKGGKYQGQTGVQLAKG